MEPATSRAESPSTSVTATHAPSAASRTAMAAPIPRPAPVTIAVRFRRSSLISSPRESLSAKEWHPDQSRLDGGVASLEDRVRLSLLRRGPARRGHQWAPLLHRDLRRRLPPRRRKLLRDGARR